METARAGFFQGPAGGAENFDLRFPVMTVHHHNILQNDPRQSGAHGFTEGLLGGEAGGQGQIRAASFGKGCGQFLGVKIALQQPGDLPPPFNPVNVDHIHPYTGDHGPSELPFLRISVMEISRGSTLISRGSTSRARPLLRT